MPMLHICCIRAGTAFGSEYVDILHDMVRRNLAEGYAGEFTCFTDQPDKLAVGIIVRPLPVDLPGWWSKLALFRADLFPAGDRVIFFDLDTVITGRLDEILAYQGDFAILRDFYRQDGLQSSVMAWEAGTNTEIWETYKAARCPMMDPGGDQAWIEHTHRDKAIRLQDVFPDLFCSYKLTQSIPAKASVCIFHGHPRPHEIVTGWVPEVWKIGGLSKAELDVICNTEIEKIYGNVRSASARDLPWFDFDDDGAHDRHAVIVGSGPSLSDPGVIDEIKWRAGLGQDIWALNGAASFLYRNDIAPAAFVMCDARQENANFALGVQPNTECLLASQCAPSVFDALAFVNRKVTLWHPNIEGILDHIGTHPDKPIHLIGGGTTVGINAITLAFLRGYRKIHLYGFDSCYRDDEHHAFPQSLNDGERILDVLYGERKFRCAPWMSGQATEFIDLWHELTSQGVVITAHGEGLIQSIAHDLQRNGTMHPFEQRAHEILKRVNGEKRPFGAEVGVFAGRMSAALLKGHPNLRLVMVDSWEGGGKAYQGDSGDFHAGLNQVQQDGAYAEARRATSFAKIRRRILRERSTEAAKRTGLTNLDFAFLDADHSEDGCRADLAAWWPKIKPGGWLCGHDYDNPQFPKFGVKRAVDQFTSQIGGKLELGENLTWFLRKEAA
jgi:hypothetical protein